MKNYEINKVYDFTVKYINFASSQQFFLYAWLLYRKFSFLQSKEISTFRKSLVLFW